MTHSLSLLKSQAILNTILHLASLSPLYGLLAGGFASAIFQSSSAIIAFTIAAAKENSIGLATALPIVFGADIGTCVTSLLASITTNLAGRRAAAAHFIFNIGSALIILLILPPFLKLVLFTSSHLPRQIANGHTLYNLIGGLLFLPLVKPFAGFISKLIPENDNIYNIK